MCLCNVSLRQDKKNKTQVNIATSYCLGAAISLGIYVAQGFIFLKALALLLLAAARVQL